MALDVYVLFENNAPKGDPDRPRYRHEEPKAVLIQKPSLDHGIDFVHAKLYSDIGHQRVCTDIGSLSEAQLKSWGFTPEKINERLVLAFGRAAVDGTGLSGQRAYVIMNKPDANANPMFRQPMPVSVVFLNATHLAGTHNPLVSRPVQIFTSLDEMRAMECAKKFKDEAKTRLSYKTRQVLGFE